MYETLEEITAWLKAEGYDAIVTSTEFRQDECDERMNLNINLALLDNVIDRDGVVDESPEARFNRAMEILDNDKQK